MSLDVAELMAFYETPLGRVARQFVGTRIRRLWPDLRGERLVGLGYAAPYCGPYVGEAERVAAFMPARMGVTRWPTEGPNRAALVEEDALPLPDHSIERVLVVHGLENTDAPEKMLREIWRVLSPGGRLLVVVPNRLGLWTRAEATPFGTGRPYSRSQLERMFAETMFTPVAAGEALFVPPTSRRIVLGSARAWERMGRRLPGAFAGVVLVEAEKRYWQPAQSGGKRARVRRLMPVLQPATQPALRMLPDPTAKSAGAKIDAETIGSH